MRDAVLDPLVVRAIFRLAPAGDEFERDVEITGIAVIGMLVWILVVENILFR